MDKLFFVFALLGVCASAYGAPRDEKEMPNARVAREESKGAGTTATVTPIARGELIFEDNFEFLDYDKWQHEITAGGGGNWEFQYYTNNRSNSYVKDNTLYIKPTLTEDMYGEGFLKSGHLSIWGASPADLCTGNNWWGCERTGSDSNYLNPIQSARLRTVNSFAFKYGTMEVIAQMPKGDWIWPAVWLLSKHNPYGQWPASGEIDLIESRGNRQLTNADGLHTGVEQVGQTLHWGPWWPNNAWPKTHNTKNLAAGATFGDDFHNFTLQWHPDGIVCYIDGEAILVVDPEDGFWEKGEFETSNPGIANPWINSADKMAPFDTEYYILMNVAIGGTGYFSDDDTNSPYAKPWLNTSPQAAKDFYLAKDNWYPTWNPDTNDGEDAALKVKSVRVWALPEEQSVSQAKEAREVSKEADTTNEGFNLVSQADTTSTVEPIERGELIFEDNFEFLDFDKWQHEITAGGGGNWEFQYYTNNRSNSYVRDNTLYIKPTLTEDMYGEGFLSSGHLSIWGASPADLCTGNNWWGCDRTGSDSNYLNPIQSARLRTVNSFAFKYGTMEVIAQMPKGDWIWPAVWLLSKHNPYGQWPASGEIDLIESRGNRNLMNTDGVHTGAEQVGQTLHWGPWWPNNAWPKTHNAKNLPAGETFGDAYHNFTLQWHPDGIVCYIDGEAILVVDPEDGFWEKGEFLANNPGIANPWITSSDKMAPFDSEYYILMNVAIGGTGYFSDDDINLPNPKPWLNTSPQAAKDFYLAKDEWYPTWNADTNNGEDAAMKVKSVRVWALPKEDEEPSHSHQLRPSLLYTFVSFILTLLGMAARRV